MHPTMRPGPVLADRQDVRRWLAELIEKADLADRNGRLLYSCTKTIRPGPVYFLGLNPGGDPASLDKTVRQDLDDSIVRPVGWSAFLDERWSGVLGDAWAGKGPGSRPLQRRVVHLLGALDLDPRDVPASNVILMRSKGAASLTEPPAKLARRCWPVHDAILRIVRPKVILVHGAGSLRLLLGLSAGVRDQEIFPCGYPHLGSCRVVQAKLADRIVTVIGFPHLSYWAVNKDKSAAALAQIKAAYGRALGQAERNNSSGLPEHVV